MLSRACEILCQLRLGFDQPALAGAPWQVLQVREMFLVFKPCTAQTVLVGQQSHRSKRCVYRHEPLVVGKRGRRCAWVHVCIIYENFACWFHGYLIHICATSALYNALDDD